MLILEEGPRELIGGPYEAFVAGAPPSPSQQKHPLTLNQSLLNPPRCQNCVSGLLLLLLLLFQSSNSRLWNIQSDLKLKTEKVHKSGTNMVHNSLFCATWSSHRSPSFMPHLSWPCISSISSSLTTKLEELSLETDTAITHTTNGSSAPRMFHF